MSGENMFAEVEPINPDSNDAQEEFLSLPYVLARMIVVRSFKCCYFTELMRRADGCVAEAARLAGIDRRQLQRELDECGIARPIRR